MIFSASSKDNHSMCHRERTELEHKYREQIDSLSARNSELDTDNRSLRQHKYELDTKVGLISTSAPEANSCSAAK